MGPQQPHSKNYNPSSNSLSSPLTDSDSSSYMTATSSVGVARTDGGGKGANGITYPPRVHQSDNDFPFVKPPQITRSLPFQPIATEQQKTMFSAPAREDPLDKCVNWRNQKNHTKRSDESSTDEFGRKLFPGNEISHYFLERSETEVIWRKP